MLAPQRAAMPKPARRLALAVGSSTGGPEALSEVFAHLGANLAVPVFVTQHMPAAFTPLLASHIARVAGCLCVEAREGEIARPGTIYIAPGNRHLLISGSAFEPIMHVTDGPQENFCRPSVDPMFRSLAKVYGRALLAVVLTGMGQDGLDGARAVAARGGTIFVQDQGSSVVWGMPGAVFAEGLAARVLPLKQMGHEVASLLGEATP